MSVLDLYKRTYTAADGGEYSISTDLTLIDPTILNEALGSDRMPWARSMSISELEIMLRNSVCFGVYKNDKDATSDSKMVGFARLVTDRTTFVYLTDVWIAENQTGHGLGIWLISCVDEWVKRVPHLRQLWLLTADSKTPFYTRKLGMRRVEEVDAFVAMVRPGNAATFS